MSWRPYFLPMKVAGVTIPRYRVSNYDVDMVVAEYRWDGDWKAVDDRRYSKKAIHMTEEEAHRAIRDDIDSRVRAQLNQRKRHKKIESRAEPAKITDATIEGWVRESIAKWESDNA